MEGVEYSWGIAKGVYRRKPLHCKKSKELFRLLVNEVTSRDVLTTKTVRKLSRRARAYICAYYSLYESINRGDGTTKLTLPLIERVVKAFKTHRAAIWLWCRLCQWLCACHEGWCDYDRRVNWWFFDMRIGVDRRSKFASTNFLEYRAHVLQWYAGSDWIQP